MALEWYLVRSKWQLSIVLMLWKKLSAGMYLLGFSRLWLCRSRMNMFTSSSLMASSVLAPLFAECSSLRFILSLMRSSAGLLCSELCMLIHDTGI